MSESAKLLMEFLYFAILAAAFAYGAVKLFRKGVPLYFQLYVMLCGCRMLERLISFAVLLCGLNSQYISAASFFGFFSAALFALSANRGTLDSIVDDKRNPANKKARLFALITPTVIAAMVVIIVAINLRNGSTFNGIALLIAASPCVPASYYNTKHLLLKDELGLLKATKSINIIVLIVYFIGFINNYLAVLLADSVALYLIRVIVFSLPALAVLASVKGAKKWKA